MRGRILQGGKLQGLIWYSSIALCQAAVAEAVEVFRRVDILFCCDSEGGLHIPAVSCVNCLHRLVQLWLAPSKSYRPHPEAWLWCEINSRRTSLALWTSSRLCCRQCESKCSGMLLCWQGLVCHKVFYPDFMLIFICSAGHIGTPGLGMYCSSGWALEGFCDASSHFIQNAGAYLPPYLFYRAWPTRSLPSTSRRPSFNQAWKSISSPTELPLHLFYHNTPRNPIQRHYVGQ